MNTAPMVVGFLAILALAATLTVREPSPGVLALAHAEIGSTLQNCEVCHTPSGLDAGCLACHDAIAGQIETGRGFHAALATDCAQCHPDHHGESFDIMESIAWRPAGRANFRHDPVAFTLKGRHDELACRRCHQTERTYLGLAQDCGACHRNVHGSDLFLGCATCHDQSRFKPASSFDHGRSFPLLGKHAEATCDRCHGGIEYREVKGKVCEACHESPHRFETPKGCEECHLGADPSWLVAQAKFDADRHADTGFELSSAHIAVACSECHQPALPYPTRYPEPARAAADCRACHEDVHRGQFAGACTQCHEESRFKPARYDRKQHTTFVLREAHSNVACNDCHTEVEGTRRFVGTPRACAECHKDPHAGQFAAACDSCHDQSRFVPTRYSTANHTQYPLIGAHGAVACNSCHGVVEGSRRFVGTPQRCGACHKNPHGTQFAGKAKADDCTACHDTNGFRIRPFDHDKRTSYKLEGAHATADCARCHRAVGNPPVRRYRETARSCAACHRDEHRGQFAARGCETCHAGNLEWEIRKFDHARTRFPLDGRHRRVSCDDCHPKVRQRDGREVVQYTPLGRQCKDCHEVERR